MTEVEQIYMHPHKNYASAGVANAGLATGIVGTVLGAAGSGILGGVLNGIGPRGYGGYGGFGGYGNAGMCDSMLPITRYEADLQAKISAKDSHIGLLEADKYTDQKIADVYERIDRRINGIEDRLCHQAVINAQLTANISCMQTAIATLNGLTKTVIPIGNVCPAPMPEFNSWTAPTAAAAG